MTKEICGNCRFSKVRNDGTERLKATMVCRRYAPRPQARSEKDKELCGYWPLEPLVVVDWGCGEWEAKKPAPAKTISV